MTHHSNNGRQAVPLPVLRGQAARNVQNVHMCDQLSAAQACLEALVRAGYTVLRIEVEGARPVLWVQACAHCEKLAGAWYRIEGGPLARTYTWQANVLGCRVQWVTDGGAA